LGKTGEKSVEHEAIINQLLVIRTGSRHVESMSFPQNPMVIYEKNVVLLCCLFDVELAKHFLGQ
jgi:hypothetical protein